MKNLFKKGFASLALASAMTTGIFAGSAAHVDVKLGQVFASTENGKDGNVTAFKMHIEKDKIVVNFDKGASYGDSMFIKLALSKKVAGDGIKGTNILFKEVRTSKLGLMPNQTDAKIDKLTFAFKQTDKANLLIISADSKKYLKNAMPFNVAVNRIGAKMHLVVTRDKTGFKGKSIIHLFANNINWDQWNKEKIILGNSNFKKQNTMTPNLNLLSDTSESTADKNTTNANLLIDNDGKADEAGKSILFTPNLFVGVNNIIPNVDTRNTDQRKIVFEPLAFNFSKTTASDPQDAKITFEPYNKHLAFNLGTTITSDPKGAKVLFEPYSKQLAFNFSKTTASDPQNAKILLNTYEPLAFNLGTTITSDPKGAKVLFEPLAFNFSKTTASDPQDAKILLNTYEPLAFNLGTTTGSDKNKIILEPHKLRALNKFSFDSKTNFGVAVTNMAA